MFAVVIGEILYNIRSSLDHVACDLVAANGGTITRQTAFPISENFGKYETEKLRKIEGMGQRAKDAIDTAKPYGGGNDILWQIHALNNIDKHRNIVSVGSVHNGTDIGGQIFGAIRAAVAIADPARLTDFPITPIILHPASASFPLKQGDELFRDAVNTEYDENLKFAFNVALCEPGIIEGGEPVIKTLYQMADFVYNLIVGFEPLLG